MFIDRYIYIEKGLIYVDLFVTTERRRRVKKTFLNVFFFHRVNGVSPPYNSED